MTGHFRRVALCRKGAWEGRVESSGPGLFQCLRGNGDPEDEEANRPASLGDAGSTQSGTGVWVLGGGPARLPADPSSRCGPLRRERPAVSPGEGASASQWPFHSAWSLE